MSKRNGPSSAAPPTGQPPGGTGRARPSNTSGGSRTSTTSGAHQTSSASAVGNQPSPTAAGNQPSTTAAPGASGPHNPQVGRRPPGRRPPRRRPPPPRPRPPPPRPPTPPTPWAQKFGINIAAVFDKNKKSGLAPDFPRLAPANNAGEPGPYIG